MTSPAEIPRPPVDLHTVIEGPSGGTDGPTGVLGAEHLAEELCGLRFRLSHTAFLQTNTEMAERLYAIAGEFAGLSGRERVFDLYCGIGTIGLSLAARRGRGLGPRGRSPRRSPTPSTTRPRTGSRTPASSAPTPGSGSRRCSSEAGRPDVVVVDPPRSGLSKKIVRRLLECEAPRIVYVSCNPTTLAPNAAQLVEAGYTLRRVKPVDMFPQTPHVECVAVFEQMSRGFGVAAGLDPEVAAPLAARCAELGYDSMWSNDHPGALGLETLKVFGDAAPERRARGRGDGARPPRPGGDQRPHRPARASTATGSGSASAPGSRSSR